MTVKLGRPAVIVVDVQNDFAHSDGKVGRGGNDMTPVHDAVGAINRLIDVARAASVPVVFVRVTHSPTVDNPAYRARYAARGMTVDDLLCADGTWGAEFYADLAAPDADELVVTKHAYDAFSVPELADHLRRRGVDTAVVTGLVSELCVMGTVAGAFEHGFHVVVPREATGSVDPAAEEAAFALIAGFYGRVASLDEVTSAMSSAAAQRAAESS